MPSERDKRKLFQVRLSLAFVIFTVYAVAAVILQGLLLTRFATYTVFTVAVIIAINRHRAHQRISLLTISAFVVLLLKDFGCAVALRRISTMQSDWSASQIGWAYTGISVSEDLASAVGIGLLVAAIFHSRGRPSL